MKYYFLLFMMLCVLSFKSYGKDVVNKNFNLTYRAGYTYDDKKIDNYYSKNNESSSDIALEYAVINFLASVKEQALYVDFSFNLISKEIENAYISWAFNKNIGASIGKKQIFQYGSLSDQYNNIMGFNLYESYLPFNKYLNVIELRFAIAGWMSFQVFNDVTADKVGSIYQSGYVNTSVGGPAGIVQWEGEFVGWKPLVQLGFYDHSKSMFYALGLSGDAFGLGLQLNYISDLRKWYERNTKGFETGEIVTDVYSVIDAVVKYPVFNFTPWVKYSYFNLKQGTDKNIADKLEDKKANLAQIFNDNQMIISGGLNYNFRKNYIVPYISYIYKAGKFYKKDVSTETENLNKSFIKVGVYGEL